MYILLKDKSKTLQLLKYNFKTKNKETNIKGKKLRYICRFFNTKKNTKIMN